MEGGYLHISVGWMWCLYKQLNSFLIYEPTLWRKTNKSFNWKTVWLLGLDDCLVSKRLEILDLHLKSNGGVTFPIFSFKNKLKNFKIKVLYPTCEMEVYKTRLARMQLFYSFFFLMLSPINAIMSIYTYVYRALVTYQTSLSIIRAIKCMFLAIICELLLWKIEFVPTF